MKLKISIDLKVSKFIKRFIIADVMLFSGWGLVDPIFSVFLIREIVGASLVTVGIAAAIYWILKSFMQIPIALFLDKTEGERDDFYTLIGALVIIGTSAIAFAFATSVWHIYLNQVLKAIGFGMYVPSWSALFSRHLDKNHYSLDWSLDSTSVGFAIGITSFLGGIIATWFGYNVVFISAGLVAFVSAAILFVAPSLVFPPRTDAGEVLIKDHTPVNINQ